MVETAIERWLEEGIEGLKSRYEGLEMDGWKRCEWEET
jgi:hypothetical protein